MPKTISSQATPCQAGAGLAHMLENQETLTPLRAKQAVIYQTRYDAFVAKLSDFPRAVRALKEMHMRFDGYRKNRVTPEWAHPLEVARHVGRYQSLIVSAYDREFFEDVVTACALHDVIEDKGGSDKEIQGSYSFNAAGMVLLVSKDKTDPNFTIDNYYYGIKNYTGPERIAIGAVIIKGSDRRHNLHTVLGLDSTRINPYVDETKKYVIPMLINATLIYPSLKGYFASTARDLTVLAAREWHEIARHRGIKQARLEGVRPRLPNPIPVQGAFNL